MAGYVWRVIHHGVTDGRDSGYPTINAVGPLFGTKKGAQAEADRLNERNGNRTMNIPVDKDKWSGEWKKVPAYEVDFFPVLTQAQADARQQEFVDQERARNEKRAADLMAQARALLDSGRVTQ